MTNRLHREVRYGPYSDDPNLTPAQNLKRRLRFEYLARRDCVNGPDALILSSAIRDELRAWKNFKEANCISSYVSVRSEVGNHAGILRSLEARKKTCVPRVCGNDILLFQIFNMNDDLEPGTFGVLEPIKSCKEVPIGEPELHIVPGVVFDRHGNRIGYGKGFYDRFLAKLPSSAITIGLAFDCQLADEIPAESTDVPLKYLITPKLGIIKCA